MQPESNENMLNTIFDKNENWRLMNSYLQLYQIPESILIKTIGYYDNNLCLRTQHELTPRFCFKYLYKMGNNNIDYNDIVNNFKNKYTKENLNNIYLMTIQEED